MLRDRQWPPPTDWQAFERLCADLWRQIWEDPYAPPKFPKALFAALDVRENDLWRGCLAEDLVEERESLRLFLRRALEKEALPPKDRVQVGQVLGLLGDDRPGVGLRPDGVPDVEWVEVPTGAFVMGSTEIVLPWMDETPQHEEHLPAFRVSRYPVTNAQYQAFVDDGGYTSRWRRCWTQAGWKWKGRREGPDDELQAVFLLPNHPRVQVSWYEAWAFCRWLGEKLGFEVRLPKGAEWEKAARGTDGRLYPWGEEFEALKCNSAEAGIASTTAVGSFPSGASPWGVLDMGGNVLEWCLNQWRDSDSEPTEDLEGEASRVWCGGSFFDDHRFVRCAYRAGDDPKEIDDDLGFRPVAPFRSTESLNSDLLNPEGGGKARRRKR